MTVVTRFAPSPTGRLHVGNIRTALHNFLFARRHGGRFILRIDDTDRERSTAEFDAAIRDDLDWLGLTPDLVVRQSERFDLYEREFERLRQAGRVYACYETPEELELRRKVLLGRGLPPVYERKPADAPVPEGRAAALALPARPRRADRLERPHPRRAEVRPEIALRPGGAPRGRQLALPAAQRHRRHRPWHHPRRSRRGPCVEQRGADPDVRGARRRAAAFRARGVAGRRRGQIVEAARLLRRRASARGRRRADGLAVAAGADRHVAAGRDRRLARRARRRFRLRAISAARRRISTRTTSNCSMRGCCTARFCRGCATACRPERRKRIGCCCARNLERLSRFRRLARSRLDGDIEPPELSHDDRAFVREAARSARAIDWSAEPVAGADAARSRSRPAARARRCSMPLRLALTGRESGPEMAPLIERIGKERALAPAGGRRRCRGKILLVADRCDVVTSYSTRVERSRVMACLCCRPRALPSARLHPAPWSSSSPAIAALLAAVMTRQDGLHQAVHPRR